MDCLSRRARNEGFDRPDPTQYRTQRPISARELHSTAPLENDAKLYFSLTCTGGPSARLAERISSRYQLLQCLAFLQGLESSTRPNMAPLSWEAIEECWCRGITGDDDGDYNDAALR